MPKNAFQNNFIKILKEENEKLKGTVRLLRNDAVMIMASQSIEMKNYANLNKNFEKMKENYN